MATRTSPAAVLFGYARGYARGRGYVIGDGAQQMLRQALDDRLGARLAGGEGEAGELVLAAEKGIVRLVDAMIDARDEVYQGDELRSNVIGESTFMAALARICPLFPFC